MKVVFISNFLNHHQLPFCKAMLEYGVDFHFVATEQIPTERTTLGYTDMNKQYPFVVRSYEDLALAKSIIQEADAVIDGTIHPSVWSKEFALNGGLTFHFSERLYKRADWTRFRPKAYHFVKDLYLQFKDLPNFYVLCAGAYVSRDLALWNFPAEKCLKFGYFPEVPAFEKDNKKENKPVSILWCGRLLSWKHPEVAIRVAEYLKEKKMNAKVTLIGNGELEESLKKEINQKQLHSHIEMMGSLPYEKVYEYMHNADIYLFTSGRYEGWGAVLNEAMGSGCAVVANNAPGSTPYLIENGKNGLIYDSDNSLTDCVNQLVENPSLRNALGKNAKETIETTWNAKYAAKQLIAFIEHYKDVDYVCPANGPCSKAEIIEE